MNDELTLEKIKAGKFTSVKLVIDWLIAQNEELTFAFADAKAGLKKIESYQSALGVTFVSDLQVIAKETLEKVNR